MEVIEPRVDAEKDHKEDALVVRLIEPLLSFIMIPQAAGK